MYGSDWFMPASEPPETYLNAFIAIYQTRQLAPYYDRFLNENAVRYLKLTQRALTIKN